jgi:GTP 3',8-cyclase
MAVEGIREVTLTTNAVLAEPFLLALREVGIRRLNISLDTLRRDRYATISGRDCFDQVWSNILKAYDLGFAPIKINVVAMKGVNDDEFQALAALTYKWPFHIRFIEYMPMGTPCLNHNAFISNGEIRQQLERLRQLEAVPRNSNDGPAERFRFPGAIGEIGFISPRSNHFCSDCNRLRLTASGKLRPCLLLDRELDIKQVLRSGACDSELAEVFIRAARSKPSAHLLNNAGGLPVNSMMTSIGG